MTGYGCATRRQNGHRRLWQQRRRSRTALHHAVAAGAAISVAAALTPSARAITIVPAYDASVLSNVNSAAIQNAFNYVALTYKNLYSDPIQVNITVVAGTTGLGGSSTSILGTQTYTQLRSQLVGDATSASDTTANASLPVSSPLPAGSAIVYTRAQAKSLGLIASDATTDGTFTFNALQPYTFSVTNRAVAGQYDFVSVAEHEVSEIMGRIPSLGTNFFGQADYLPFDLFRWTGPGARNLSDAAGVYFSIDSGTTNLKNFNFANGNGSDPQDWASGSNDAYNAFGSTSVMNLLSPVDVITNDVIGYNLANLVWSGATDNTTWNVFSTSNWNNGATTMYTDAALVLFNDSSPGAANTVNLTQTVYPTSVTVSSSVNNFTINGVGSIAGLGSLTKSGSSTLIITTNNTYTGGTTISGGTLQIGNGGTSGSITGNVVDNGALVFNRSDSIAFTGNITGTGSLTKNGTGTLTLSGANTYSGGTTIKGGGASTLQLGANNAAGGSAGSLSMVGGTFAMGAFNQSVNNVSFGDGSTALSGSVTGTGTLTVGGNINFNGTSGFTTPFASISPNVALAAGTRSISDNGFFSSANAYDVILSGTISGSGLLRLAANNIGFQAAITHASNTYTGGTTVDNGTLFVAATNALPTGTVLTVNGGFLNLNPPLTLNGVTAGNYSQTVGSLAGAGGTINLGNATLTVGNLNTNTTYAGTIQGSNGSLTKVGSGTLTLTGPALYTGATSVSAGKLALATNLANNTSSVSVTGGILQLTPLKTRVIVTQSLIVSGTGKIDLTNNKLIHKGGVAVVGTWNGTAYTGTTGLVAAGYHGGDFLGAFGIITTESAATGGNTLTNIGIAKNSDLGYATFAGQSVNSTDVIVMYTYGGDANLDGAITGDDYFQIDSGFPAGARGWFNGDFNYDGSITGDDYFIIDSNFPAQGAAFPTSEDAGGTTPLPVELDRSHISGGGLTPVPEPGAAVLTAISGATMMGTRRRRFP